MPEPLAAPVFTAPPPARSGASMIGVGTALPATVVPNAVIAERLGIDASWIVKRTGIEERRSAQPGERLFEFAAAAPQATLVPCLAADALAALDHGDAVAHDQAAARAATALPEVDVVALAQFSLARAAHMVEAATGKPVLTTPDSAVRKLQRLLLTQKAA